jgi:hypothetical protein
MLAGVKSLFLGSACLLLGSLVVACGDSDSGVDADAIDGDPTGSDVSSRDEEESESSDEPDESADAQGTSEGGDGADSDSSETAADERDTEAQDADEEAADDDELESETDEPTDAEQPEDELTDAEQLEDEQGEGDGADADSDGNEEADSSEGEADSPVDQDEQDQEAEDSDDEFPPPADLQAADCQPEPGPSIDQAADAELFYEAEDSNGVWSITQHGEDIYFVDAPRVLRLSPGSDTPEVIFENDSGSSMGGLMVNESELFFVSNYSVYRAPLDGSAEAEVFWEYEEAFNDNLLGIDDTNLYFFDRSEDASLVKIGLGDSERDVITTGITNRDLLSHAGFVYYFQGVNSSATSIVRQAIDGGEPEELASIQTPQSVETDGSTLYVGTSDGIWGKAIGTDDDLVQLMAGPVASGDTFLDLTLVGERIYWQSEDYHVGYVDVTDGDCGTIASLEIEWAAFTSEAVYITDDAGLYRLPPP